MAIFIFTASVLAAARILASTIGFTFGTTLPIILSDSSGMPASAAIRLVAGFTLVPVELPAQPVITNMRKISDISTLAIENLLHISIKKMTWY